MSKMCCSYENELLPPHLPPFPGGIAARESDGGAGGAEPAHGAAGEQLQGVGTLPWPVWEETPGQPPFFFCLNPKSH